MITQKIFDSSDRQELQRSLRLLISVIPDPVKEPKAWLSWVYLAFDFAMIAVVGALGIYAWKSDSYLLMALYVFLQGSCFWSLFIIGHDSGHGSFARKKWVNDLSGYLCHSFLLIPYYSWKLSHHRHHSYHNMIERDETHVALPRSFWDDYVRDFSSASKREKVWVIFYALVSKAGLSFLLYLFDSHVMKKEAFSHFRPSEQIFQKARTHIRFSVAAVAAVLVLLGMAAGKAGFGFVFYIYFAPWLIFSFWIYFVTFLQHTHEDNHWFYQRDWHFLKGALQTIDYDYGPVFGPVVTFFHHGIQRYHLVHHLIPSVPHYHLKAAHEAIEPLIRDVYRLETNPFGLYVKIKYRLGLTLVDDRTEEKKTYSMLPVSKQ